ncbi:MAG: hypothetical protein A2172_02810 [Candidatus Woykebacteria bacterium RBG_13_40_15]|uniref:Uncharacterized protein n=1 Tax=Candidatus Woykebacteria bacterium RBG_13_40_15 TaxID=1802593 RepID=A0A1G1W8G8_9BACT|nr:MAG: hypothetical protein A2172_02810 [Candidatus Woykebacteria bacterium RBG_13_40_15]
MVAGLIWFIFTCNIKPLQINTQINIALHQAEKGNFETALAIMENALPRHSFLDNYLRLQYVSIIGQAIEKNPENAVCPPLWIEDPENTVCLPCRACEILKENIKIRPYYTRNWMLLGYYTNVLIIQTEDSQPELIKQLKEDADYYLKKANELSPKRQDILVEWIKTDILSEKYEVAKEKARKCIDYNPKFRECYWQMSLINIYLGNEEEAEKYYQITKETYYDINSEIALLQLVNAYIKTEDYQKLAATYQKLVELKPEKIQYRASLAVCYQKLGQIEKAREEALKILKSSPESKEDVEKFLKELEK